MAKGFSIQNPGFSLWTAKYVDPVVDNLKQGKKLFTRDIKSRLYTSYIYLNQQNSYFDMICKPFIRLVKIGQ